MGFFSALSSAGSSLGSGAMNLASGLSLHDATGGWSDFSSRQSSAKYQARLNSRYAKQLATWEALNLPSYQVQGLRSAGLNPLLAISNGISTPSLSASTQMHPASGDSKPFSAFSEMVRQQLDNQKKEGKVLQKTAEKIEADTDKSQADSTKTKVDTYKDVVAPVLGAAATAYAGKKAGDAATALIKSGLTKNSAKDIIKEVAPKAASSARNAKTLWPVLGGLLGLGIPGAAVGGGILSDLSMRDIINRQKNKSQKQKDKEWAEWTTHRATMPY